MRILNNHLVHISEITQILIRPIANLVGSSTDAANNYTALKDQSTCVKDEVIECFCMYVYGNW